MPAIKDKEILVPLNKLLEANDRLAGAINMTRDTWPYVSECWIDQMSEPTVALRKYRLREEPKD